MTSQGCSYDVISKGIPLNKLEYQSEGVHTCRERVPTKVALFHTCMSGHYIREESLLVLKLITVREGIPHLMMSQGYPYDITSEGIPHNNKLKYHRSSYMHAKSANSGTI